MLTSVGQNVKVTGTFSELLLRVLQNNLGPYTRLRDRCVVGCRWVQTEHGQLGAILLPKVTAAFDRFRLCHTGGRDTPDGDVTEPVATRMVTGPARTTGRNVGGYG